MISMRIKHKLLDTTRPSIAPWHVPNQLPCQLTVARIIDALAFERSAWPGSQWLEWAWIPGAIGKIKEVAIWVRSETYCHKLLVNKYIFKICGSIWCKLFLGVTPHWRTFFPRIADWSPTWWFTERTATHNRWPIKISWWPVILKYETTIEYHRWWFVCSCVV